MLTHSKFYNIFSSPFSFYFLLCRPLNFKINYEFVDLYQDGMPFDNDQGCNRKFVSSLIDQQMEPIIFRSIRNVFFFGRSGAINLK